MAAETESAVSNEGWEQSAKGGADNVLINDMSEQGKRETVCKRIQGKCVCDKYDSYNYTRGMQYCGTCDRSRYIQCRVYAAIVKAKLVYIKNLTVKKLAFLLVCQRGNKWKLLQL